MSALIPPVSPSCASCSRPVANPHGTNTVYLRCPDISHVFHRACIAEHIRSSGPDADKCPACMTPISAENRRIIPLNNVQLPTELQSPVLRTQSAARSPAVREGEQQEDATWLAETGAARETEVRERKTEEERRRTFFHSPNPLRALAASQQGVVSRIREKNSAMQAAVDQSEQRDQEVGSQSASAANLIPQLHAIQIAAQESTRLAQQVQTPTTSPSPPTASSSFSTPTPLSSITTTFGSAITTTRRAVVIAAAVATIACLIFFPMVTSVLTYTLVSALLPAPFPTITTNVVIVIAQLIFMRTFIFPGTLCNVPNWCARLW